ncbi:tetratricopeptide repeat protein [Iningainema sp. BLCCT55]|uniref:Tetratricopeptide repeat protein n=1 Tax=Iningainema tapete BLCC-T55 TaxID=2748662 RepID=A0A8J7CCG6_9CYAN|nr:tetratricopeptide repeat protein [Iningainema tapete BLCC-T55]
MSDSLPLREKYLALINEIVQSTLKGKISSAEQVYQMLLKGVTTDTGEVFELVLSEHLNATQQQVDTEKDELKQAKATRSLRAMKTIQSQWQRAEQQNQANSAIATAVKEITTASPSERIATLLSVTDANRKQPLSLQQLQQLSKSLQSFAQANSDLQQIASAIARSLTTWQQLQDHLVSWMYERRESLGFGGVPGENGPWATWAKQVNSTFSQALLRTLAREESAIEFAQQNTSVTIGDWVEMALILQYLQRSLVNWFDQQPYNVKAGSNLSISTFLTFAVIWSQLANGFGDTLYSKASSQIMLQILRNFAQRPYFPLYGGIFASFSGSYLRDALSYLDEPLRQAEGTQEKARILTLLGYSQRAMGQYQRSIDFHREALEIARSAGDGACEIANFNHLSRTYVQDRVYTEAINYSQRALILSRQTGDRTGEANALVNLGYSEVMQAQQEEEQVEPEVYEAAINYLQQGLTLSERLGDVQSKALCFSSLGIAYLVIEQPEVAIKHLESGFNTAQTSGDLYLQGLNLSNLAEAYYDLLNMEKAIYTGCLGMYLLNQISSYEWNTPAELLTILQQQIGAEAFQDLLQQNRSKIISVIGVDGYDYIPQLLEQYQQSL